MSKKQQLNYLKNIHIKLICKTEKNKKKGAYEVPRGRRKEYCLFLNVQYLS